MKHPFNARAPAFDAAAIQATIQRAFASAGLDTTTGPMQGVTETIRRALAARGPADAAQRFDGASVIDVVARTVPAVDDGQAASDRGPPLGDAQQPGQERPAALLRSLQRRAGDWSETRPEWGLAGNAAFVAAPRRRTAHLDMGGRAFLHDYDPDHDEDASLLRQILTAPVVVAHWINMQYYASTVDNAQFGSGNKVLHDVVGGTLGVFEGFGGDLRTGLPLQSLHDGQRWQHVPLRLSVYVEAPAERIDAVLETEPKVRNLVENGWLHLLQIDPRSGRALQRRPDGAWAPSLGLEVPRAFG